MKRYGFFLSLLTGFIIILISVYGFFLLRQRPGFSYDMKEKLGRRDITRRVQIDDLDFERLQDLEFILSQKTIGDEVTLSFESGGKREKQNVRLVAYYAETPYLPFIYLFSGLFCFIIGIAVFLLRSEDAMARIFYWASFAFSAPIIISGGFYCLRKGGLSYLPGILNYFLYPLAPAFLLGFSLLFSKRRMKISKFIIYFPALCFAAVLATLFLYSGLNSSLETYRVYQSFYSVFRAYLVLFVLVAVFHLVICYRKAPLEEEKARIKWIFYGLFVGLIPFILLYQLPQVVGLKPLMTEESSQMFFIVIPLSFAFAIVRFKLMNIELVINRSIVYFILTVVTVGIYLFSVALIQNLFSRFFVSSQTAVSVIAAFAAAAAFHPARKKIQEFVDKAFFRVSYDYRKSILSFNERASKILRSENLVDFFLMKIKQTLPVEEMTVFVYSSESGEEKLLIARNGKRDLSSLGPLSLYSDKILARKKAVRTEENIDFSQERLLEEKNLELFIPFSFQSADLSGFLACGRKKSGEKFSRDDLDLLLTVARELAINLERIRLQEKVFEERSEKERLDELSRLKTEFISSVSHELRTPMSSIQGLAEMLQAGKIKDKAKQEELLSLVAGESSRLSRFLHNILDFGKIEQKVKSYNFEKIEIQPLIKETLKLFQQKIDSEKYVLHIDMPKEPLFLNIDQDAVKQALTNLIDNAIKYSSAKREIGIKVVDKEKDVEIQVRDKGIGIPEEAKEKIFEGFYRHADAVRHSPKGVGLGLKIVKHIIEAHQGEIRVESQANEGSTFTLVFPKP